MNCDDVLFMKPQEFISTLKKYNDLRSLLPPSPFPRKLLMCSKQKISELLTERNKRVGKPSILEHLSFDEIFQIGGLVLSSFPLEDFEKVEDIDKALALHR